MKVPQSIIGRMRKRYFDILRELVQVLFPLLQPLGVHVTVNHYYSTIPDTRELTDDIWAQHSKLVGIDMNVEAQLALLSELKHTKEEYTVFPEDKTHSKHQYYKNNSYFSSIDGEICYHMIRHFRPRRILEIGSGLSTYLIAHAALRNEEDGYPCETTVIDPYPNETVKRGFPGLSRVITMRVQGVPLSVFSELDANDILFIDSSHALRIGGDVQYEYLEILPRLKEGVIVHVHDVFLPTEYPRDWVLRRQLFWTEQYLLQAFLAFNSDFEVLLAGNYLHLRQGNALKVALTSYKSGDGSSPGSFWMRRKRCERSPLVSNRCN